MILWRNWKDNCESPMVAKIVFQKNSALFCIPRNFQAEILISGSAFLLPLFVCFLKLKRKSLNFYTSLSPSLTPLLLFFTPINTKNYGASFIFFACSYIPDYHFQPFFYLSFRSSSSGVGLRRLPQRPRAPYSWRVRTNTKIKIFLYEEEEKGEILIFVVLTAIALPLLSLYCSFLLLPHLQSIYAKCLWWFLYLRWKSRNCLSSFIFCILLNIVSLPPFLKMLLSYWIITRARNGRWRRWWKALQRLVSKPVKQQFIYYSIILFIYPILL